MGSVHPRDQSAAQTPLPRRAVVRDRPAEMHLIVDTVAPTQETAMSLSPKTYDPDTCSEMSE